MNKKGLLGTIIFIIILLIAGLFWFVGWYNDQIPQEEPECTFDTDCIPDACCHPTSCTAIENTPVCEDVFCTAACEPGTLDCGQGSCACIEGKCTGIINEE